MCDQFKVEIRTNGAAFDGRPGIEVARILRELADAVEHGGKCVRVLRDANGNTCGRAEYWDAAPDTLTVEDWIEKYDPIPDGGQECCGLDGHEYGFHTLAGALQFAIANGVGDYDSHVWTITHGDDDDDECGGGGAWMVSPGIHRVNVIGFVITRKPHDGSEVAIWD